MFVLLGLRLCFDAVVVVFVWLWLYLVCGMLRCFVVKVLLRVLVVWTGCDVGCLFGYLVGCLIR